MVSTCADEGESPQLQQNDCCGNGCANCVLNVKPKQTLKAATIGKKNILAIYSRFRLVNKTPHTPQLSDVLELHFTATKENTATADFLLDIPPGHHIMLRAPLAEVAADERTNTILRPFSPFWSSMLQLEFKILVNLKPQGIMSKYIANLRLNDEVEIRGPIGVYARDLCKEDCAIFVITQGVAIAPTLPIVEEILENDEDMCRVYHLCCFVDLAHAYFRSRIHDYNKYWNYKGRIYLAHQQCGSDACRNSGGCTDVCENFTKSLRYKEAIFTQRLCSTDIAEVCNIARGGAAEKVFIISGSRDFQTFIVDAIKEAEIAVEDKKIFLL